jgi:hypothetical protein
MLNTYYEILQILEPRDWGKNFGLEKNHSNKTKYKRAMSWFLHASISIQSISIYHNYAS